MSVIEENYVRLLNVVFVLLFWGESCKLGQRN